MHTPTRTPSSQALPLLLTLVIAGALMPGRAIGQSVPAEDAPEGPRSVRLEDPQGSEVIQDPGDECEDYDDDGECDPVWAALGVVVAEYLPRLTDGIRLGYGWAPGGGVYGGRLEWTLRRSQARQLRLSAGMWTAPLQALRPGAGSRSPGPTGRDGAFALTLGGSAPLRDLGLPAPRSIRGVAEATVLAGSPGRQLRLAVGPRYRMALQGEARKALAIDLMVGTNLTGGGLAPRAALRIGWSWD